MSARPLVILGDSWANLSIAPLTALHSGPVKPVSHASLISHWVESWDVEHVGEHAAISTIVQPGDLVYLSIGGIERLTQVPLLEQITNLKALYDLLLSVPGVDVIHAMYAERIPSPLTHLIDHPHLPLRPWTSVRAHNPFGTHRPLGSRRERPLSVYAKRIEVFGFGAIDAGMDIIDGLHLTPANYAERSAYVYAHSRYLGG